MSPSSCWLPKPRSHSQRGQLLECYVMRYSLKGYFPGSLNDLVHLSNATTNVMRYSLEGYFPGKTAPKGTQCEHWNRGNTATKDSAGTFSGLIFILQRLTCTNLILAALCVVTYGAFYPWHFWPHQINDQLVESKSANNSMCRLLSEADFPLIALTRSSRDCVVRVIFCYGIEKHVVI